MWISFPVFGLNVAVMYSEPSYVVVLLAFNVKCVIHQDHTRSIIH